MATVLTNTARSELSSALNGSTLTVPKYVGWGTGAGTSAVTDTTLFTEADSRVTGTPSVTTTSVTNDTFQVVSTNTAGSGETITNAGIFDATTSGNLYVKGDFSGVVLNTGDKIQFTITIQHT